MRPKVSVCMIVRNEEAHIRKCLESVQYWADEIVVVDALSTDKTVEICSEFDCRVLNREWTDHFSDARNFSIEAAANDWVFIIDADEVIETQDVGELLLAMTDTETDAVRVGVYSVQPGMVGGTILQSIRAFRKSTGMRYEGRVHNTLPFWDFRGLHISQHEVKILHYGYGLDPDGMIAKCLRTRRLLDMEIEEGTNLIKTNLYLAQNWFFSSCGEPDHFERAIVYAKAVLAGIPEGQGMDARLMSLYFIAAGKLELKDYAAGVSACKDGLALWPEFLDLQWIIARCLLESGDANVDAADKAFQVYLLSADNYDPTKMTAGVIMIHSAEQIRACAELVRINEYRKDQLEVARWVSEAKRYARLFSGHQ